MAKHYPVEQRERAVKMVLDHLDEYRSVYAACQAIGPKVNIPRLRSRKRLCWRRLQHLSVVSVTPTTRAGLHSAPPGAVGV